MDDMKREVYMRVREMLVSGKETYICLALRRAIADTTKDLTYMACSTKEVIEDAFTEFLALNDGVRWVYHVGEGPVPYSVGDCHEEGWWNWKEPVDLSCSREVSASYIQHVNDAVKWTLDARLRVIDLLLRD